MIAVRHWLPALICVAGVLLAAVTRTTEGLEGGALLVSAGLSVWLLNVLYRLGVRGDSDRAREDAARAFYDEHGHWPDEPRPDAGDQPAGATHPHPHRVPRHGQRRRR